MTRDRLLALLFSIPLGLGIVSFILGISKVVTKPFELIYGESFEWYLSDLVSRGGPLFQPLTSTELLTIPHTPLFALISGGLSVIFGSSITVGRVVSLVCGVGLVILVTLITKKLTNSWGAGVLVGLLLITTKVFRFLAPLNRMDTMGVMFSLLGVYMVDRYWDRGRLIYWAVIPLTLAFLTKQYFIAAPIAVGLYYVVKSRELGKVVRFGCVYAGALGVSLLVGGLLTNWEMIIQNFVHLIGHGSQLSGSLWIGQVRAGVFYHWPWLLLVGTYFVYKCIKGHRPGLLDTYFLVAAVVMIISIGKRGASYHYMLEMVTVGCILVGSLLGGVFEAFKGKSPILRRYIVLGGLLVLLLSVQSVGFPIGQGLRSFEYWDTTPKGYQEVEAYLVDCGFPLLSDNWVYPMLVRQRGLPIDWQPWDPAAVFVGKLQYVEGRFGWDQSLTVNRLNTGYYRLVILEYDLEEVWDSGPGSTTWEWLFNERISVELGRAIVENYELVHTTDWVGTIQQPFKEYIYEYRRIDEGESSS